MQRRLTERCIVSKISHTEVLNKFLSEISMPDPLQFSFSDALWHATVDHVLVHADGQLVFHFGNGSVIPTYGKEVTE